MATSKIQTGIRIEEEALKKITYIAKMKKRSMNAQVEYLVQKCIDEYEQEKGEIIIEEEHI